MAEVISTKVRREDVVPAERVMSMSLGTHNEGGRPVSMNPAKGPKGCGAWSAGYRGCRGVMAPPSRKTPEPEPGWVMHGRGSLGGPALTLG